MPDSHPLKVWIDENTSQVEFARSVPCSEAYLSEILSDKKEPSLAMAGKMSRATGGAVAMEQFVGRLASQSTGTAQ